jgi:outer membrane lipoprotein-sorting protein
MTRTASITGIAAALAAACLLAACGGPGTPLGPPSAQDVLAKPTHANLKDAHFLVTGKFSNQGTSVDISGDGALVYKAPGAGRFKFKTSVAGQQVSFEDISINGNDYTFTVPGNGKWTSKATTSGLGPNSFSGASDFKYVGEESLPKGKTWHARAKDKDGNLFDGWIRESDGYPLKYTITQQSNALTLSFDKYNTGESIAAPPASQVVQG